MRVRALPVLPHVDYTLVRTCTRRRYEGGGVFGTVRSWLEKLEKGARPYVEKTVLRLTDCWASWRGSSSSDIEKEKAALHNLILKIEDCRGQLSVDQDDVRHYCLTSLRHLAVTTWGYLCLHEKNGPRAAATIRRLFDLHPRSDDVIEDLVRLHFSNLLLSFLFQAEHLFRRLLATHHPKRANRRFKGLLRSILGALEISRQPDKIKIAMAAISIRNAFHENMYYKNISSDQRWDAWGLRIKDVTYRFTDGKQITCNTWLHIILALAAFFDVMEEAINAHGEKFPDEERIPV